MDEKEAEARPVMGTIFLVNKYTDEKYLNQTRCREDLCLLHLPSHTRKSPELT